MKVLVTGATGFIGNYVVEELLKNNHQVIATSLHENKAEKFSWFKKVEYFNLDFSHFKNDTNYFQFFKEPEKIIHLAWQGLPNYKSSFHIKENLPRHFSFLKNLALNGAKELTISGTCMEYGLQEGELNEQMISSPQNPYSIAKDSLRNLLEQLQKEFPFQLKWLRLFYMFGRGQNPNSILSQLEAALKRGDSTFNMSGGEQQRDYLPVETVAEYVVKIATQEKVTGIINCCSGIPISINQLIENYLAEKNQKIKLNKGFYSYPDYEPMNFWGNNSKLKKAIS
ncbi:MAG: NAD-dependent epimerase/dehydratase family protein [Ginsengibacter sp.]